MEDTQIVSLYFARNSNAIKETSSKYGKLCYSVANAVLHCKEDNEECVNDTYLTAWNTIPPQKPVYLSAFLCRITRNLSLKKYGFNHAKKRRTDFCVSLSELDDMITDGRDTFEELESKELGEVINGFLRAQPPQIRNFFILRYFFFYPVKSIAASFNCSQSKVKSTLARTRERLATYLKNYYFKGDI